MTEPRKVITKNFTEAYMRLAPPQPPTIRYIGISATSQNT